MDFLFPVGAQQSRKRFGALCCAPSTLYSLATHKKKKSLLEDGKQGDPVWLKRGGMDATRFWQGAWQG